jgi:hypothetical protein
MQAKTFLPRHNKTSFMGCFIHLFKENTRPKCAMVRNNIVKKFVIKTLPKNSFYPNWFSIFSHDINFIWFQLPIFTKGIINILGINQDIIKYDIHQCSNFDTWCNLKYPPNTCVTIFLFFDFVIPT